MLKVSVSILVFSKSIPVSEDVNGVNNVSLGFEQEYISNRKSDEKKQYTADDDTLKESDFIK